jgi:uncharacterized secreted protein with C-terminal beta-propeller domain
MPRRRPVRFPPASTAPFAVGLERLEPRFALSVSWSSGAWTITGDDDPSRPDDTIVVDRDPADPRQLRALVNGEVVDTRRLSAVRLVRISGGNGDDTITVDLPDSTGIRTRLLGGAGNDTILGGAGRDRIRGGSGNDTLNGGGGDDAVAGGAGDDSLVGAAGDDRLHGDDGDDTLRGGDGRNTLRGGAGIDAFFGRPGQDRVRLAADEQLIGNETTNPLRAVDDSGQLQSWYVDTALARWGSWLGGEAPVWGGWPIAIDGLRDEAAVSALAGTSTSPAGTGDYSGTNNQVAGVDEADMVKTDGAHVFVLAGDGVDIVQAWPADALAVVGHVTTPGWETALFLAGSRLTVISQDHDAGPVAEPPVAESLDVDAGGAARIAPWTTSWRPVTIVSVIDVSIPSAATILETTRLDGWLVDARAIDGRVLVVTQDDVAIPAPAVIDDGERSIYEDEAAYRRRLAEAWGTALPRFSVTSPAGESSGGLVVPGSTFLPVQAGDASVLTVVSFEVGDGQVGPEASTSVAGVSGSVYASTSSLYVSATHWGAWWDATDTGTTTNIYKFDIGSAAMPLVAMGAVAGTTLDQFSLDETADGLLRVATTSGFGDGASSGVFVLSAAGGNLQTIGRVTGLAPGERIFSARFVGDVGYVSTFREVDPLFVLDLADPAAPRVVGELKVPGFSTYLHPLDATHLLGVGRDVDPDTGRVLGLQLSIFDVGDPAKPERTAAWTFAGDGWESWSEALWDHHALSWFGDHGILALPVQQGSWWEGTSGLVVFRVDPDAAESFTNLGQISHDGPVQRGLRIGEFLYSVSAGQVKAHRLDDPGAEAGSVTLTRSPEPEVVVAW